MAVSLNSSTPTLSSPGLGSGLDVAGLVAKLMAAEQQPMTDLQNRAKTYVSTISALGTVKASLSSLQSALKRLSDPASLLSLKATTSSASVVTVNAGAGAVGGSYALEVTQLAQAQKLASAGFANTTDIIGSGTLTFDFGTTAGTVFTSSGAAATSVTIGAGQTTLSGVRDAINAANVGVTATIVNDGSANGNRLVFTSQKSGAANSVRISVADDDGTSGNASGLSQLAYDPAGTAGAGSNLTQKVGALNALFTIDGIAVSKPTNVVTDAIQGVTLNLLQTNAGTPATVGVNADSSAVTSAVQSFVSTYNSLHDTLASLTKYDAATQTGSVLTGDSTVRIIQAQLRGVVGNAIPGLPSGLGTLSQAGITFQTDGTLTLDTAKLTTAIAGNSRGVIDLFASQGHATDSLVSVAATTAATKAGNYAVSVSQLATRGSLVGSTASDLEIIAGVNDQLNVTVDGVTASITLSARTYANADALASEVQARINGASALTTAASSVSVQQSGGVLTISSQRYGSASAITVAGNGAASLLGTAVQTTGLDVAGTIDGRAALGSGQSLSSAAGSVTEGLKLSILGGALGSRGSIAYTRGYATTLNDLVTPILSSTGLIASRTDGLNVNMKEIQKREDIVQKRLDVLQKQYTTQFSALDGMLANMQATSSFLTQQLANLPNFNKNN